jgi:hypothetical protein
VISVHIQAVFCKYIGVSYSIFTQLQKEYIAYLPDLPIGISSVNKLTKPAMKFHQLYKQNSVCFLLSFFGYATVSKHLI